MIKKKKLSNPFSTGSGGSHFEAQVQASFVALMLTGGYAPCLPCWPIKEIKLQCKIDGFDTDDLVVIIENSSSKERRKLVGQVKHSITLTHGSQLFSEVIQAAWNDFNNPEIFTKGKDIIALITGPLSTTDTHNVQWLLNQARHTKNVEEFFRNVLKTNFSPSKSNEKLKAIRHHLKLANGGNDISKDELYSFLKHFHLLSYDLGNEFGVILSLLHSHISQFQQQSSKWAWSRVLEIVQVWNKDGGTFTTENLPEDILEAFRQKAVAEIPDELKAPPETSPTEWLLHKDSTYLALSVLIGSWQDKNQNDQKVIAKLLGISYEEWIKKAREILHFPDSPISHNSGTWKIVKRTELWMLLGQRILDQDLETFKSLSLSVLQEQDPIFDLEPEIRYAANIHGKVLKHSHVLRKGITEGLAILGTNPDSCIHCTLDKTKSTCGIVIRELLHNANWVLWGSLNSLLPTLAEADPNGFLNAVGTTLQLSPCPFDELFSQEGIGITGSNYLTGLLWALEVLAWDEQYLVRVCDLLGELASHDPGGKWANRPSNSLATILLPWFPQTLASLEKRKVAVENIFNEWPVIAWDLTIQLLPGQHQTSIGSHKPSWRQIIPDDWQKGVKNQEYWQQILFYSELAVTAAGKDITRLSVLIDNFDNLPLPAFNQLLQALRSEHIFQLPEEQRLHIWDHLTKFTNKHRRFSEAKWALSNKLVSSIEQVADKLAPTDPFYFYQHLFTNRDIDLYEEKGGWREQGEKLNRHRETAISKIFEQKGIEGVIHLTESVSSPNQVGHALGAINEFIIDQTLLPQFLETSNNKLKSMVCGYVWRKYHADGWGWCDTIDKTSWTVKQIGEFLACLPFTKNTWDRASQWLQENESEYWAPASTNPYQDEDLTYAIEKLITYGRPYAAINCLYRMHHTKQSIDTSQCIRALLAALTSREPSNAMDIYSIVEIIKLLQTDPSVNKNDLFKVEWYYLSLLDHHNGASPKLLESKLSNDAKFFSEIIEMIYRSKNDEENSKEASEKSAEIAINSWQLLKEWKTPPGTQENGEFDHDHFTKWLKEVKKICTNSGHLEFALTHIGEVLIHAPTDLSGLWIHQTVASVLNQRDNEDMRNGFSTGIYNSRGAHWVDPTGAAEEKLSEKFQQKAEAIENAGFPRFATTLRNLAEVYNREAKQVILDHRKRYGD